MEVENYPKWKETTIGGNHFSLSLVWEEGCPKMDGITVILWLPDVQLPDLKWWFWLRLLWCLFLCWLMVQQLPPPKTKTDPDFWLQFHPLAFYVMPKSDLHFRVISGIRISFAPDVDAGYPGSGNMAFSSLIIFNPLDKISFITSGVFVVFYPHGLLLNVSSPPNSINKISSININSLPTSSGYPSPPKKKVPWQFLPQTFPHINHIKNG